MFDWDTFFTKVVDGYEENQGNGWRRHLADHQLRTDDFVAAAAVVVDDGSHQAC